MFYDIYCKLCEDHGEKPFSLPLKLGMKSNSAVAQWKNGSVPRKAMLEKIADYFGVTVGYLLDGEEKEKPAGQTADGLDELEDDLIKAFRRLPDQMKESLLRKIQADAEFYGLPPRD